MILVLRLVSKISRQTYSWAKQESGQLKINKVVTSSHIVLILLFTVFSILHFNVATTSGKQGDLHNLLVSVKLQTVWTLVGGVSDLFITCMLWFVLD